MSKILIQKQSLTQLIKSIQEEVETGKTAAETALEKQKSITYWQIGKKINDYLEIKQKRKGYGDYVFLKLSEALDIGIRTLYRIVQFHEEYPKFLSEPMRLTWTHFRILLTVADETKRGEYEQEILAGNLSSRELLELIQRENQALLGDDYIKKLAESRGKPCVYRIITIKTSKTSFKDCLDLGFRIYLDKAVMGKKKFPEGTVVEAVNNNGIYSFTTLSEDANLRLYTYPGYVEEIIDGDTLWVNLDLGFDTWSSQKIRLRGINADSLDTGVGRKAKEYLVEKLMDNERIIVKTHYRDKYNRFLGDIFYAPREMDIYKIAEQGIYLNQELLNNRIVDTYRGKVKRKVKEIVSAVRTQSP